MSFSGPVMFNFNFKTSHLLGSESDDDDDVGIGRRSSFLKDSAPSEQKGKSVVSTFFVIVCFNDL